ncbi:phosphodiester glycosidase family protein [Planktothrix sp. FACHB-1355]|uniref:Phosphodiester glycosidase family protein n=1 Tax=Aerosakkonema funiforme FACHB-1375 TaxID=2949571 RepID=A0A926ZER7_9CYAN|nr:MULTISPECIES: phosphodiester glycosidase family protein [Oscillatoriales]MBD2180368.1 phosphodiester glycosidase family protein [Aerosakkonema funiforme FACHB-1375]MBD3557500.1 phosphodiester glycosidase family protein [Planktothrix sp. FACHB-1355]
MKKVWLLFWILVSSLGLVVVLLSNARTRPTKTSTHTVESPQSAEIVYKFYTLPQSVVHTLLIPKTSRFSVRPVVSPTLEPVENVAATHQTFAAINGGFFDPVNQKTTSIVIRQGELIADPKLNERFINNPKNAPYLDKMLNRSELRRYICGGTIRYDINFRNEPIPDSCRLVDALGGGPRLLPELGLVPEGFADVANGKIIRDALGSNRPNARTAIGITLDGSLLWVMVAQKPEKPTSSGMSLSELAKFMKSLGVEKAMNLDGGSSSSFYYKGQTFYGKVDSKGNWVRRPVKSVLLVF